MGSNRVEVIPAIDLRGGRAVRLVQGDYSRETVFDDDPVRVARRWESEGAPRIHVVDLDGARDGVPTQRSFIERIAKAVSTPVQVGGAIRSLEDGQRLLEAGVSRIVFGTAAVENPDLVAQACEHFGPQRVVVGIDSRDGRAAVRGWRESTDRSSIEVAREMVARGAVRFVYTDIARDGMLEGPNLEAVAEFAGAFDAAVVASGGVATADDVRALAATGVEGVIIGRALYTGALTVESALEAAQAGSAAG